MNYFDVNLIARVLGVETVQERRAMEGDTEYVELVIIDTEYKYGRRIPVDTMRITQGDVDAKMCMEYIVSRYKYYKYERKDDEANSVQSEEDS